MAGQWRVHAQILKMKLDCLRNCLIYVRGFHFYPMSKIVLGFILSSTLKQNWMWRLNGVFQKYSLECAVNSA